VIVALAACVYVRGWLRLRSAGTSVVPGWRVGCGLAGLCLIWVAVSSPLATLDHQWLTAHMIQHLLLMSVAPPLIWLGAPAIAMLNGLPRVVTAMVHRLPRRDLVNPTASGIGLLAFGWFVAAVTLVGWHVPEALSLGLQSHAWHLVQHASFLAAGLLFWWPVVCPRPGTRNGSQWSTVVYLFLATLPCDILSAFLVFSERLAYPIYLSASGHSEASVLDDQQRAGALMWTCVTLVYVMAGTIVTIRSLTAGRDQGASARTHPTVHAHERRSEGAGLTHALSRRNPLP
jgi:putative membrane protein